MTKPVKNQPGIPVAFLAAAVALSVTSPADASLTAVLLQTQHAHFARHHGGRQTYDRWINHFAVAARQVQRTVNGDALVANQSGSATTEYDWGFESRSSTGLGACLADRSRQHELAVFVSQRRVRWADQPGETLPFAMSVLPPPAR